MSSWDCPHDADGVCQKVNQLPCDPGMKGCVLAGRFVFSNPEKNRPGKAAGTEPEGTQGKAAPPKRR